MPEHSDPIDRHWSQIAAGDVVLATKSAWTLVERVEHRRGWLVVFGRDLTGRRRGEDVVRFLRKSRLHPVREVADGDGELRRLTWTHHSAGAWSAAGYEILRDRPGANWRIVRDGASWDSARSIIDAKRLCERDFFRRVDPSAARDGCAGLRKKDGTCWSGDGGSEIRKKDGTTWSGD